MKKIIFIIQITCIVSLFSCVKKTETNDSIAVNINLKENLAPKSIYYSDYIDSISYVVLKNKNIIGNVKNIKYINEKYYVYDGSASSILIFEKNGNYYNTLSMHGKGPNEYLTIDAFDVNPITGDISILEVSSKRITRYSINGQMLKRIKIKNLARYFAVFPSGNYLLFTPDYMENNRRGLWKINDNGKFIDQLLSIDTKHKFEILKPNFFNRLNNDTIGLIGIEDKDEIYHITDTNVKAKYKMKFDIDFPVKIKEKESTTIDLGKYAGKIYTKDFYLEFKNLMLLAVSDFKKSKLIFFDKNKGETISDFEFINNIDGVIGFPTSYYFENKIVNNVPPVLPINFPKERKDFHNNFVDSLNIEMPKNSIILQILHLKN